MHIGECMSLDVCLWFSFVLVFCHFLSINVNGRDNDKIGSDIKHLEEECTPKLKEETEKTFQQGVGLTNVGVCVSCPLRLTVTHNTLLCLCLQRR